MAMFGRVAASAAVGALALGLGAPASAAPPPASAFGRLPAIQDAAISADGTKIAILSAQGDRRMMSISPIDGAQAISVDLGRAEVRSVRFAGNDHLLVNASVLYRWMNAAAGGKHVYHYDRDLTSRPTASCRAGC